MLLVVHLVLTSLVPGTVGETGNLTSLTAVLERQGDRMLQGLHLLLAQCQASFSHQTLRSAQSTKLTKST